MAKGVFRKALLPAALLAFGLAGGYTAAQAQSQQNPSAAEPHSGQPMTEQSASTSMKPTTGTKALSRRDRNFLTSAAQGGIEEVEGGQMAAQKAQSQQVKELADRMAQDHNQANDKLKQIASDKGVTVPDKLPSAEQRELDKLNKLSGASFDRAFASHEVADHKKVIREFEQQAKMGSDPDLKQFAQDALPTLREHLRLAEDAEKAAKSASRSGS